MNSRDLDAEVSAQGATHEAALVAIDDVVAAIDGEPGNAPTDGKLLDIGVDSEVDRSQADELPVALQ